jgi:hypothetical protein
MGCNQFHLPKLVFIETANNTINTIDVTRRMQITKTSRINSIGFNDTVLDVLVSGSTLFLRVLKHDNLSIILVIPCTCVVILFF